MVAQVFDGGKFNVDKLYEKFGHFILDHKANLQALTLERNERNMSRRRNEEYKVWPAYAKNLHKINYVSTINLVTNCDLDINDLKKCSMEDRFTFQIQMDKSSSAIKS